MPDSTCSSARQCMTPITRSLLQIKRMLRSPQNIPLRAPSAKQETSLQRTGNFPQLAAGDIIAVLDAGAYGFAMSSQYNCRPRCPEVLIRGSQVSLMREGETVGDITAPMRRPPWQR